MELAVSKKQVSDFSIQLASEKAESIAQIAGMQEEYETLRQSNNK